MFARKGLVAAVVLVGSLAVSSCAVPLSARSGLLISRLQMVSAGHTGCLPQENEISNVVANADGSGTWNASCKGKVFLCSAVGSTGGSESFSCAPVAK